MGSVYTFRKEEPFGNIVTPGLTPRKLEYKTSRKLKYDGFVVGSIPKIISSYFARNTPPKLSAILEKHNEDTVLSEFKRTTL